jgi:hypothetical protein
VGPRAGLDGCVKSRPTGIRSPDRPCINNLSGFITAAAVFRKPNAISPCFSIDLVLNFLLTYVSPKYIPVAYPGILLGGFNKFS